MPPILMTNEEGVTSPAIATTRDQIEMLITSFVLHAIATGIATAPSPAATPLLPPLVGTGECGKGGGVNVSSVHSGIPAWSQPPPSRGACAAGGGSGGEERHHGRPADQEARRLESLQRLESERLESEQPAAHTYAASDVARSGVGVAVLGSNRRQTWVGGSEVTASAGSKVGLMRVAQALAAGVSPSDYIAARVCPLKSLISYCANCHARMCTHTLSSRPHDGVMLIRLMSVCMCAAGGRG